MYDDSQLDTTQLDIAKVFATVASDLATQPDIDSVSDRIARVATTVLGCQWAQVVRLGNRGTLEYRTPDDVTLAMLMKLTADSEGDLVADAVGGAGVLVVDDFATDRRWPEFTARLMEETPIRSAMAFSLQLGDEALGAVLMLSTEERYFSPAMQETGALLAEHAAIALAHASSVRRANNLDVALTTNRKIGVAVGVLMVRHGVTDEQAFAMLRKASQHLHRKLRDIADYVAMAGELPPAEEDAESEPWDVRAVA
jgi:GAF domain-containing protein